MPIYIGSQYRGLAKQAKLQNRLENADFSLPDLFGDILGGNKKDIAGSHKVPRLHDDVDWKRYFIFVVCTPESSVLRDEGKEASMREEKNIFKQKENVQIQIIQLR